ncbi:MAG: hypothetical protein ABWY55_04905 [Microbacterium sp.]
MSADDGTRPNRADDRILPVTRWVGIAIVPFLVVAAFLLFAFPESTGELFAWAISPPLSAFLLASAYVGGIWFFVRAAFAAKWHRIRHGFPAVAVFAGALLVATLLHLDKFSSNLSFAVWITLYATTPFVIVGLIIAQRGRDGGRADDVDVVIPGIARAGLVLIGAAAFATGAVIFLVPGLAVDNWAWKLTPLTAQVLGAVLSLTGVVNAGMLRDARWSSFRILFQAQLISLATIAVSLAVRHDDLIWDRPVTYAFLVLIGLALAGYASFTVWCELRLRAAVKVAA